MIDWVTYLMLYSPKAINIICTSIVRFVEPLCVKRLSGRWQATVRSKQSFTSVVVGGYVIEVGADFRWLDTAWV